MPRWGNTEEALAALGRNNPTGRLAEPVDIADVIVFLATDAARYIVGQLIHVNGGDYHGVAQSPTVEGRVRFIDSDKDIRMIVMWSGGIDSTFKLAYLLRGDRATRSTRIT